MSANSLQFQSSSDATLSEPSHENQTANDGDLRAFLMPVTSSSPILAIYTEYSLDADINAGNFAEASGLMVGDDVILFFHYFPHVVKAAIQCLSAPSSLGSCFSRLLLSDYHSIPRCAAFVVLAPIDQGNTTMSPSYYAAFDTIGSLFFTIRATFSISPRPIRCRG